MLFLWDNNRYTKEVIMYDTISGIKHNGERPDAVLIDSQEMEVNSQEEQVRLDKYINNMVKPALAIDGRIEILDDN